LLELNRLLMPLDPRLASFVASGALVLAIGVLMGSAL
jgi:hypothetical protein